MTTLLSAEKYRLLHSKVMAIVLAGVAIMKAFFVFAPYMMNIMPTVPNGNNVASAEYSLHFSGLNGVRLMNGESIILIIWFVAFVGFFIASEFQDGTIRNALSLGKRRTMVFTTKLLGAFAALTAIFAVTILTAVIGNTLLYGFGSMNAFEFIDYFASNFFLQLLYHLPYAAIFCLFAFIGRNSGMSIILGVGYLIFNSLAPSFLGNIPGLGFAMKLFPEYYINNFDKLGGDISFIISSVLVSVAYIVIACVISCITFNKSDVK